MKKYHKAETTYPNINLIIFAVILYILVLLPIPSSIAPCALCLECPPCSILRIHWSPSLARRFLNSFYYKKSRSVGTIYITPVSEMTEDFVEPTLEPIPTFEPFDNWSRRYNSQKYKFSITYPRNAEGGEPFTNDVNEEAFGIYLRGGDTFGGYVFIGILKNPKQLTLNQLGNDLNSRDCSGMGEIRDLGWINTNFLGYDAIYTSMPTPCDPPDSYQMEIYLLKHNNSIFSLEISYYDEPNSTYFQDLSNQVLSTFKFLD